MQELRVVLIFIGILAVGVLILHGLWNNKSNVKYNDNTFGKQSRIKHKKNIVYGVNLKDEPLKKIKREDRETIFEEGSEDPQKTDEHLSEKIVKSAIKGVDLETAEKTPKEGKELNQSIDNEQNRLESICKKHNIKGNGDIVVIHVHSFDDAGLDNDILFHCLEKEDLSLGDMSIYHYYSERDGNTETIFSIASMMKPGTLESIQKPTFYTKGISLFMNLPSLGEGDQDFNLMLGTAQRIADNLSAEVLDDKHNLMTPNRLVEYRKQIHSFL